ncbi:MAG: hypothetical protein JNJ43_12250 [Anaerolineales bacterium]|nr:hypothetical protein [Anaerolineales bacterium]
MQKYIIESPHTAENCEQAVKDIHAAGYLHHFEWGCKDNDHTAWAIVEAESPEHAKQMIPWYLREKVRIVKVVKFEVADEEHHAKQK